MTNHCNDERIITFDELYRDCALKALNRAGTVKGAATLLGIPERTLFRWKKNFGIERDPVTNEYYVHPLKKR